MPSLQGIWLGGYNVPVPLASPPLVPYSVTSYWIAIRHAMQGPLALKGQRDLLQNLRLVTEADAPRDKQMARQLHHSHQQTLPWPCRLTQSYCGIHLLKLPSFSYLCLRVFPGCPVCSVYTQYKGCFGPQVVEVTGEISLAFIANELTAFVPPNS